MNFAFVSNPKILVLIDAVGALLSAILLGVILVQFESYFGMPISTLYFLVLFPILYFMSDLWCYLKIKANVSTYLRMIAIANLIYCGISIGLVALHFQKLTILGLFYFLLEFIVIILLSRIELNTAARLNTS